MLSEEILKLIALKELKEENLLSRISISVLDLNDTKAEIISLNGSKRHYPASIIKLFWAIQALSELNYDSSLNETLEKMIIDSSDEAGQRIIDWLIGHDPVFEKDYEKHFEKRQKLNSFWHSRRYFSVKAHHKTFLNEYSQFDAWIKKYKSQNLSNSVEIVRLWQEIWRKDFGEKISEKILDWSKRQPIRERLKPEEKNYQGSLIGYCLPPNCLLHSKAGWRDNTINDSAIIEFPDSKRFIIAIFSDLDEEKGINFIRGFTESLMKKLNLIANSSQ